MDFVPLSLRDVKLEKSDIAWSDIGGALISILLLFFTDLNFAIFRFISNSSNTSRNFGMANKVWTYFQAITVKVAVWVRNFHPCIMIYQARRLSFRLVSSFMGFLDVERLCWPLQWQKNVA